MTAREKFEDALRERGLLVKGNSAQCPAHPDGSPSLSIGDRRDGKGFVLKCHGGCENTDVMGAVGMTLRDFFDDSEMRDAYAPKRDYLYPGGRGVHRKPDKSFPQSGNKADKSLFHADRIGDACLVYAVEGEKDVEAIEALGGVAVCSAMGAGKAQLADWSPLAGLDVTVVADKDAAGRKHATDIAGLLTGIARSVRIAEAAAGKDAADHIAGGHGLNEFVTVTEDDQADGSEPMPRLWRATDLKPAQQPSWLAKGRLPRGAVSLLIGDEGIGKSLFWVWIAAAITTGKPLPEFGIPVRPPAHVLVVCTEDDWSTTVRPRLEVAEADLGMVYVICTEEDGSGSPIFPRDIFLILEADPAPALIVVDAWLDTVSAGLSVRDPQQARQALHPWKEVATATAAAVLLLTHTNRVASPNARDRYGASYALRQKARLTLYAQQDDDDGALLIGPEKANSTAQIAASKFTIVSKQFFEATEEHDGSVPLLSYMGESDRTAREHVAASADDCDADDRTAAENWLEDYLTEQGAALSKTAKADAAKVGIVERTLQRAVNSLGVTVESRGFPRVTWWQLPSRATDPISQNLGATGATGDDLHKHHGATGPNSQSRQPVENGVTGGTTGRTRDPDGNAAYVNGLCRDCKTNPYSAGRPRCEDCHRKHMTLMAGYDR